MTADREASPRSRGVCRRQAPVSVVHPDLKGWEPILGDIYAPAGSTAEVIEWRPADEAGDIAGRAYRDVTIVVTEPGGTRTQSAWRYRRKADADGPQPLDALREDFGRRLNTEYLSEVAESIPVREQLHKPAELPNNSARKAFHYLVQIERDLESWERFFAAHPQGPMHFGAISRLVEDAYRVGRWAREMELAPALQPELDERRNSRALRSRKAIENGLGQDRQQGAEDRWKRLGREIVRAELAEDPGQEIDMLIEALRARRDTKQDIQLPKKTTLIRRSVESWVNEFLSETRPKLARDSALLDSSEPSPDSAANR